MTTDQKTSPLPPGARRPQGQEEQDWRTLALFALQDALQDVVPGITSASGFHVAVTAIRDRLAALPSQAAPQEEQRIRQYLWLSHGHQGVYGDDGEMQCGECARFGEYDYKRAPISALLDVIEKWHQERLVKAMAALPSQAEGHRNIAEDMAKCRYCSKWGPCPEHTFDPTPCSTCLGTSGLNMSQGGATDCPTCHGSGKAQPTEGQPLPPDAQERLIAEATRWLAMEPWLRNFQDTERLIRDLLQALSAPRSSGAAPGGQPASGEIANIVAAMRKDADDIIATHQRIGSQALGPDGLVVQTLRAWADRLATLLPSAEGQ